MGVDIPLSGFTAGEQISEDQKRYALYYVHGKRGILWAGDESIEMLYLNLFLDCA